LISRYGEAIEMDLVDRGIDLAEHWRKRRWRRLLNIVDRLPSWSHFADALADDEEYARVILAADASGGSEARAPRVRDWSPLHDEVTVLVDRVGELISITAAAHGGKAHIPPRPRPRTAADRLRDARHLAAHEALTRRLLGDRR
jgi:hypothetical protein